MRPLGLKGFGVCSGQGGFRVQGFRGLGVERFRGVLEFSGFRVLGLRVLVLRNLGF